jgi:translation initiation factor IF-2
MHIQVHCFEFIWRLLYMSDDGILKLKGVSTGSTQSLKQHSKTVFTRGGKRGVTVEVAGSRGASKPKYDSGLSQQISQLFPNLTDEERKARISALEVSRKKVLDDARDLEAAKASVIIKTEVTDNYVQADEKMPVLKQSSIAVPKQDLQRKNKIVSKHGDAKVDDQEEGRNEIKKVQKKVGKKNIADPEWIDDLLDDEDELADIVQEVRGEMRGIVGRGIVNSAKHKKIKPKHMELESDTHSHSSSNIASFDNTIESTRSVRRKEKKSDIRDIIIGDAGIGLLDLAHRMSVDIEELLLTIHDLTGEDAKDKIEPDLAELIIREFGHNPVSVDLMSMLYDSGDKNDVRPPIVVVMGHVDHGKTSLLDAIRGSSITSGEAGGITQKVNAYVIETKDKKKITFVDTPGHAVFKEMRARGASFTDIVILLVAADDGVKAQTIEAIEHAKTSGVPIIVVINKMDKPNADPNRVRRELINYGIAVESFGGDILEVCVSAKTGEGLEELQSAILLQAEMLALRTNNTGRAHGVVIDSLMDNKRQGIVVTLLLTGGTLHNRDVFVCGDTYGKVRSMFANGKNTNEAAASSSAAILGFSEVPPVGSNFYVVRSEKEAKIIIDKQAAKREVAENKAINDGVFKFGLQAEKKIMKFVIKADTSGSAEAISNSLEALANDDMDIKVLHCDVGDITENDLIAADLAGACVIGFDVKAERKVNTKYAHVEIKYYSIIYELIDYVLKEMKRLIGDKFKEIYHGNAKVTHVFDMKDDDGHKFRVAGCMVQDGSILRGDNMRIRSKRGEKAVIKDSVMSSLEIRRIAVDEVARGQECGIVLKKNNEIAVGDIFECFELEKIN